MDKRTIIRNLSEKYAARLEMYAALRREAAERAALDPRIIALNDRRLRLLAEGGDTEEVVREMKAIEAGYLPKINYSCALCRDTGRIGDKYCSCFRNAYFKELKKMSGMDSLPTFTFADNRIDDIASSQSGYLAKLYSTMKEYCAKFPDTKRKNIVLRGSVGVGKSCLVSAVANGVLERGYTVQYVTAYELNTMFLKYHTSRIDDRDLFIDNLTDCDLLVIDDLGTEPILKNVTVEYLLMILDTRITAGKATAITTNLNSEQLMSRYGERTISRLIGSGNAYSFEIKDGDDLRKLLNEKA